ncbi:hypothetical protein DXG01_014913 [Tephrocybe rancida]|nr:hypothetical protein DXG01_014913 [Tephrocybe rancida]
MAPLTELVKVYFYYTYYPKDGYGLKSLVSVIWILDTVHVVFSFGDVASLARGNWSLFVNFFPWAAIMLLQLTSFMRQTSIAINFLHSTDIRSELSPNKMVAVRHHRRRGCRAFLFWNGFKIREFSRLREAKFISVLPFGVTAILSDVLIATALCFLLASNRSEFEDTNLIIHKLIVFAINRCILTSVVAIVEVGVFVSLPESFYSFAFDFIIGKCKELPGLVDMAIILTVFPSVRQFATRDLELSVSDAEQGLRAPDETVRHKVDGEFRP